MQHVRPHVRLVRVICAAGVLCLAGCGSGDGGADGASAPATTEPSATATATPTTTIAASTTETTMITTSTTGSAVSSSTGSGEDGALRGVRYCEVLLIRPGDGGPVAEVWGTQGLNLCPAERWEALDPAAIQAEYGALGVKMNGPRHFVVDDVFGMELPEAETRRYGDLEMQLLATVDIGSAAGAPYTPVSVDRSNTWGFDAGSEIYVLTDPAGDEWVMQAYSQIVDADLTEDDLPGLGARLDLPDGWTFSTRTLDQRLEVAAADGVAVVLQDELENTYQRR